MNPTHDEILFALTNRYGNYIFEVHGLDADWHVVEAILSDDGGSTRVVVRVTARKLLRNPGSHRDGIRRAFAEARESKPAP